MKKTKLCAICRLRPAEVPDRERPWDDKPRVCAECHAKRLGGDMVHILEHKRNNAQA